MRKNMKHKIIVVDDDKLNLILATRLLSQSYEVITLHSGAELFNTLEDLTPTLILLDIQMPEMDGFEVIKKLKTNENLNKIPVIFLTADRSENTERECFEQGAVDFITKPFVPAIMQQRVKRTIELEDYRQNLERMVLNQLQKITQLQSDIIITMANIIESRDGTTGEHVKRTGFYVKLLADNMKAKGLYKDELSEEFIDLMFRATPMHDIGKITVPDSTLQKAGRLTTEEYEVMKNHAAAGSNLILDNLVNLEENDFIKIASDMARHHHEKWNGNGYPDKLKGTNIPLSARILAVADVFDALVAKRCYKEGMSVDDALAIMIKDSGEAFEASILQVFMDSRDELVELTKKLNP